MRTKLILLSSLLLIGCSSADNNPLWTLQKKLQSKRFVDLTHSFAPGIPHHPLLPDEERETLATVAKDGFFLERFSHVGQWGTHVDPPVHFYEGGRNLDDLTPKEMILPLIVIDVHEKVVDNHDYVVTMKDIEAWEEQHGKIPSKSFVAMRTDWSKRWPDGEAMQNVKDDGAKHYPGWSQDVLTYLIEKRYVTAIGHETTDTDPGLATTNDDYALEYYVLSKDRYQIELMTNLDQVPEVGAIVVATWPKPEGGSGFPARVFAIVP